MENNNISAADENVEELKETNAAEEKTEKSLSDDNRDKKSASMPLSNPRKIAPLTRGKKIMWVVVAIFVFIVAVQIAVADKYRAQVLVIEGEKKVGVNPTTENLDFGDLSGDTTAARYISLNAGGASTYIYILKFGSIAELIKLSENSFTLKEGDNKKIEFSLYMPLSAPVGERYTGRVWIFKIPRLW